MGRIACVVNVRSAVHGASVFCELGSRFDLDECYPACAIGETIKSLELPRTWCPFLKETQCTFLVFFGWIMKCLCDVK